VAAAKLQPLAQIAKGPPVRIQVDRRGAKARIKTRNDLGTRIKLQISPIHLVENLFAVYLITYARTDASIPWMNCCKFQQPFVIPDHLSENNFRQHLAGSHMDQCCPVCEGKISFREDRWVLSGGYDIRVESDISIFFANNANMKYAPVYTVSTTRLTSIL